MLQLFLALQYLQQQNIMHRDIKPDNLMLKDLEGTQLCLVDFGLADYHHPSGKYLFTKCGTPGFVAPEILHEQIYNHKVDVFSAGVIMYVMLSGQYPFKSQTYEEVVHKNFECEINFDFKYKITEEAKDLLQKILQKDFNQRYSATEALNHPWFKQVTKHIFEKFDFDLTVDDESPNIHMEKQCDIIQRNVAMNYKNLFQNSPMS